YNPLNNFVPSTFGDLIENVLNEPSNYHAGFRPLVDIIKTDKQLEIELTAPGLTKEDFKIDLNDNQLVISGERKLDEDKKAHYTKRESNFGEFRRAFKLSDDIDQEKITANYEAGILTVVLPISEKKINKKVIKVG
ncbi:MAG: Hsp20/alpha crystallin family protein, partial [Bacteroidota bacterium]